MTVADRFVQFLREKKITQKEFEELTGFSAKNISNWLNGKVKSPRIELITALLSHFPEFNIEWLLLGREEMWVEEFSELKDAEASAPVSAEGIQFLGKLASPELLEQLVEAKDMLIKSQAKQIEGLERELERVK